MSWMCAICFCTMLAQCNTIICERWREVNWMCIKYLLKEKVKEWTFYKQRNRLDFSMFLLLASFLLKCINWTDGYLYVKRIWWMTLSWLITSVHFALYQANSHRFSAPIHSTRSLQSFFLLPVSPSLRVVTATSHSHSHPLSLLHPLSLSLSHSHIERTGVTSHWQVTRQVCQRKVFLSLISETCQTGVYFNTAGVYSFSAFSEEKKEWERERAQVLSLCTRFYSKAARHTCNRRGGDAVCARLWVSSPSSWCAWQREERMNFTFSIGTVE